MRATAESRRPREERTRAPTTTRHEGPATSEGGQLAEILEWLDHMIESGADWIAIFVRTDSALVGTGTRRRSAKVLRTRTRPNRESPRRPRQPAETRRG